MFKRCLKYLLLGLGWLSALCCGLFVLLVFFFGDCADKLGHLADRMEK